MTSNQKVSVFVNRVLTWGLPLLYLLIADSFYLRTYDSAQVKITLLQMGGTVLTAFWLIKMVHDERPIFHHQWPVLAPLACLLGSGIFSFLHSEYRVISMDEFLRRVFYMLLAAIVMREFNTDSKIKSLLKILVVATAICSVYGLIQWLDYRFFSGQEFGTDPFIWRLAFANRIFSTFGNPNFFGNFLVIVFPILGSLYLKTRNKAYWPLIGLVVFCIVFTYTKGAWIGFTVALAIFVVLAMLNLPEQALDIWRLMIYSLMVVNACVLLSLHGRQKLLALGVLVILGGLLYYKAIQRRVRQFLLTSLVGAVILCFVGVGIYINKRVDSARFRIFTWLSTWEMIETHPIIGSGIGLFKVIYPAYRRPAIFHIEGRHNTETDHAEDEYLEVWFDEGLLGFGIFLWLIVSYCTMGYLALRRFSRQKIPEPGASSKGPPVTQTDPRAYYMLGFLAAFLGMLAHNLVDVSMRFVSTGVYVGLLTGLIGSLIVNHPLPQTAEEAGSEKVFLSGVRGTPYFIFLRLVQWVAFGGLVYLAGAIFLQEFSSLQGPLGALGHPGERLQWFISWAVFLAVVISAAYGFLKALFASESFATPVVMALMFYPLLLFWGYFKADVHHNRAIFHSKRQEWDQALANYFEVNRLNPGFPMAHYFRGNVYNDRWNMEKQSQAKWGDSPGQIRDDFERTLAAYDDVAKIAPNYVQMHHQRGLVYLKMGDRLMQMAGQAQAQGNKAEAARYIVQAREEWKQALHYFQMYFNLDPVFPPNYFRMAWIHVQFKDFKKAEELYLAYLSGKHCHLGHTHEDPEGYTNLGNVRYMAGNFPGAEEAFKKAIAVNPNYVNALRNLVVLYSRSGRNQDAFALWQKLRVLAPNDPDIQRMFGPPLPAKS